VQLPLKNEEKINVQCFCIIDRTELITIKNFTLLYLILYFQKYPFKSIRFKIFVNLLKKCSVKK